MKKPQNYKDLTDGMLQLFQDLVENKVNLDKANTIVKTSNAIVNIQRTKIISDKESEDNQSNFFKD